MTIEQPAKQESEELVCIAPRSDAQQEQSKTSIVVEAPQEHAL